MLYAYGENGFTFLLFQQLMQTGKLCRPFVANLKNFSKGETFPELIPSFFDIAPEAAKPEVWLFPNFGKSQGFGEPDALVLIGDYSFWIEVETTFDLARRRCAAAKAIRQLLRFHYLSRTVANGCKVRGTKNAHMAVVGPTFNENGDVRTGVLRVARHQAWRRIGTRLINSAHKKMDHYILLSDCRMNAIREPDSSGAIPLPELFDSCVNTIHRKVEEYSQVVLQRKAPDKPCIKRFWYQYFRGDLQGRDGVELNTVYAEYVPRTHS